MIGRSKMPVVLELTRKFTSSLMEKNLKAIKSLKQYLRILKKILKISKFSASYTTFEFLSEETFPVQST